MMNKLQIQTRSGDFVTDPPIANLLFNSRIFAVVWLVVRVLLGWAWLEPGLHKLSDPAWTQTGEALKKSWTGMVANIKFDWYRAFIQGMLDSGAYTWFAKLVVAGEIMVGVCLILGAFVGIAAFVGGFMNWNFIMAGSASTNGLLFAAAVLLILAWKSAGYYGLDRYLLRLIGTPWRGVDAPTPPEVVRQAPAH
jgi:thiosulfate dehydrogenase [quinone] large subunit